MGAGEDDEDAQSLVAGEAVVRAGWHEGCLSFIDIYGLAFDREHSSSFEHEVNLVVFVRLLPVRLRRDEDVDADLESRRAVDDLVASAALLQAAPGQLDVERVHRASLTGPSARGRDAKRCS